MSQIELFTAAQVLDSGIKIPSPPALLNELNALMDAPEVNVNKVAMLISRDAGATAMLFKLAGSPMFGGRKVPDTIEAVINMLGLATVADLVRGMLLRSSLSDASPFFHWFWERSDAVASLAGTIAAKLKSARIPPGHARMASLFMDCGVAVLAGRDAAYIEAFQGPAGHGYSWQKVKAMDARFKTDHAVVGNMIAKHWKLPAYVCDAIRMHHETEIAPGQVANLVAIMRLACHAFQHKGHNEDPDWENTGASTLATLHLNDDELIDLIDEV